MDYYCTAHRKHTPTPRTEREQLVAFNCPGSATEAWGVDWPFWTAWSQAPCLACHYSSHQRKDRGRAVGGWALKRPAGPGSAIFMPSTPALGVAAAAKIIYLYEKPSSCVLGLIARHQSPAGGGFAGRWSPLPLPSSASIAIEDQCEQILPLQHPIIFHFWLPFQ